MSEYNEVTHYAVGDDRALVDVVRSLRRYTAHSNRRTLCINPVQMRIHDVLPQQKARRRPAMCTLEHLSARLAYDLASISASACQYGRSGHRSLAVYCCVAPSTTLA